MAQSSTARQMGPSLSIVQLSAMAPVRGTNPKVGRRPVTPQRVEGDEMEPSVSEPIAKATQPAEVAEAEPADEPLDPCFGFHGLRVRPPNHLSPMASAPSVVLAMSTAPASSRRLTTVASASKHLLFEATCSPGGGIAFHGEQILRAPGQAVQRAAIFSCGDVGVGFAGLREGAVFGDGDDEVQRGSYLRRRAIYICVRSSDETFLVRTRSASSGMVAKARSSRFFGNDDDSVTVDGLLLLGVDFCAGRQRIEDVGRGNVVGQMELADGA